MNALVRIGTCLLLVTLGCSRHDHASEERRAESITHFSPDTELFVEFPALAVGSESAFAAHVTRLDSFKPLLVGEVTVVLSGTGAPEERFTTSGATSPGIFRPVAVPTHAGDRTLSVSIKGDGINDRHDLGPVTVFEDVDEARDPQKEEDSATATVTFLKEQQWRVPFATASVEEMTLRESLRAHAVLRPRADGEARISTPATGRIVTRPDEAPVLGMAVTPETVLGLLAPRLSEATDPAELERAVARAQRDYEQARRERQRLEELFRTEAVPERRVLSARHDEKDAQSDLEAAQHRLKQYQGVHRTAEGEPAGRIAIRSPIAGTLVQVHVAPGEFVEEGRELFDVVDLERLWLEVHIPEADIARVENASGAWFEVSGFPAAFDVTAEAGGRLIALGGVIDPESRTVPLVLEVRNPSGTLRAGMFADAHVLTGEARTAPAIPVSAIVEEGAESVAYVQQGGEAFDRRILTLGRRDRGFVEVLSGLRPGERVVTTGAYYLRLASSSGSVPAHGHAH